MGQAYWGSAVYRRLSATYQKPRELNDADLDHDRLRVFHFGVAKLLFRWLLCDHVTALCNGNDPEWCRYICGTEARCIGLVIGQILIDALERVRG
jgi:hypothetical protein